jgi:hypothetical protein
MLPLHTPEGNLVGSNKRLEDYFEQFDANRRYQEASKRWEALNVERAEAMIRGKALPIRPMGIELNPCYIKKNND